MPSQPRLKFLDRYLTFWIFLAMGLGLLIGNLLPPEILNKLSGDAQEINPLLAIGLILMMYPPLAKADYSKLHDIIRKPKLLWLSLLLNWVIGPVLMFALAILFLGDEPGYLHGLILIGTARCIAMVLVWNDLAGGNRELGAALVGLNSLFQLFTYSFFAWLSIAVLLPLIGYQGNDIHLEFSFVARMTAIYLGIPFLLGILSRWMFIRTKGKEWFQHRFIPAISPITLIALLATIVYMFTLRAESIVQLPMEVGKIAIPLVLYFLIMFLSSYYFAKKSGASYSENAAISFTAAGNNFELAIAVAISVYGIQSDAAFAGIIGPLIEVPTLILLVNWIRKKKEGYPSRLR